MHKGIEMHFTDSHGVSSTTVYQDPAFAASKMKAMLDLGYKCKARYEGGTTWYPGMSFFGGHARRL